MSAIKGYTEDGRPIREFYSTKEAAEYLGLSVPTVKSHVVYSGKLKGELITPRARIFRQEELDAFLASDVKAGRPAKGTQPAKLKKPKSSKKSE